MAKRKKGSTSETPPSKKRRKGDSPSAHHKHGDFDPDREYQIKSILDETKTHYLISWEDDEASGETFADTWEPKENANREAVQDWRKQKGKKKSMIACFFVIRARNHD